MSYRKTLGRMSGIGVFIAFLFAMLAFAPQAQARESLAFAGTYDFAGNFGANGPGMMALHGGSETLYILDPSNNRILKFDISDLLNPAPENFSDLGTNEITQADGSALSLVGHSNIAVDNSGGPQDGTIYLATNTPSNSRAYAYAASGEFLYTFSHNAQNEFAVGGTPQGGRAVAVANDGPRAGEIFRLGEDENHSSTYTPSSTAGEPPTVRLPTMVQRSPIFVTPFSDSLGAAYGDEGQEIHLVSPPSLFGGLGTSFYQSESLEFAGGYNFGSWGDAFDATVAPDGTILARRTSGDGGFGRFRRTGISRTWPPPVVSGTELVGTFGSGDQGSGLGMIESPAGYFFATDTANGQINIFEPTTAPDAEIHEPGSVNLNTAELRGTVNAQNLTVTNCEFEWGTGATYGNSEPCSTTPTGDGDTEVTATIPVTPQSTYHARVVVDASNSTRSVSPDLEFQAPDLPEAATLPAGPQQRKGSAVLGGTVNPNNTPTRYYIEYSTDSGLAGSSRYPAEKNVSIEVGASPVRVSQVVPGLENDTTYYFRVVAETKAGSDAGSIESFHTFVEPSEPQPTTCENAGFRGGPSASLPDCRAWERVSPSEKDGGWVSQGAVIPSINGDRVTFSSPTAYSDQVEGLGMDTQYMAERGDGTWEVSPMNPPFTLNQSAIGNGLGYSAFTPDLDRVIGVDYNIDMGGPDTPVSNSTAFMWETESDGNKLLEQSSYLNMIGGQSPPVYEAMAGLSTDGKSGFLAAQGNLPVDEGPTVSSQGLYWWSESDGLSLASVLPSGQPAPVGYPRAFMSRLSPDANRLLWSVQELPGRPGSRELLLARRGESSLWVTQADGTPQPADSGLVTETGVTRIVLGHTPDLRYIVFAAESKLTGSATATSGSADLYRFDTDTETLVDLTTSDPAGGGVETIVGISDDGQRVYFIARGNLAPGATGSGRKLYVSHPGGIRLITDYSGATAGTMELLSLAQAGYSRLSRTSDDGRYFLFAYDGATAGTAMEGFYETNGHRLLYRYDFAEDRIDCVSCHPAGRDANADTYMTMPFRYRSGGAADRRGRGPERHFMTDSGEVMFVTAQSLLPSDNNSAADTYIWDGDTRLLTTGSGKWPQWAEAASEDWSEIFVLTARKLVDADIDTQTDLYVAKVNGGLASQQVSPTLEPDPECSGEACQGLGSESPESPRLDSSNPAAADPTPANQCSRQRAMFQRTAQAMRQRLLRFRKARQIAKVSIARYKQNQNRATRKRAVRSLRVLKQRRMQVKRVAPMHKRSKAALIRCRGGAS